MFRDKFRLLCEFLLENWFCIFIMDQAYTFWYCSSQKTILHLTPPHLGMLLQDQSDVAYTASVRRLYLKFPAMVFFSPGSIGTYIKTKNF